MLSELHALQNGYTPLHFAAWRGRATCVECLLSTPGIDVNIKNFVSWSIECCESHNNIYMYILVNYPILIPFTCTYTCTTERANSSSHDNTFTCMLNNEKKIT